MTTPVIEEFDWDAFMRDTLEASVAASGAWLRCLYKMRLSVTRGRISIPIASYARLFGTNVDQAKALLDEIESLQIGDAVTERNGNITLINRRMFRDWQSKEANRIRQLRFRQVHGDAEQTPENNASITEMSQTPHYVFKEKNKEVDKELNTERRKEKKYVEQVFAFWQEHLKHPAAKLTNERRRSISARLTEGYSVDEIKKAIQGCGSSLYHMGANDQGKVYDDLTLICRSGSKLEQFIGYLDRKDVPKESNNGKFQHDIRDKSQVGKWDGNEVAVDETPCSVCGELYCLTAHRPTEAAA